MLEVPGRLDCSSWSTKPSVTFEQRIYQKGNRVLSTKQIVCLSKNKNSHNILKNVLSPLAYTYFSYIFIQYEYGGTVCFDQNKTFLDISVDLFLVNLKKKQVRNKKIQQKF